MIIKVFDRYVMIIDVETANSVDQPLPYDVGWIVLDTVTGEIVRQYSYAVAEIFYDHELMSSAYYAKKLPKYREEIANGTRIVKGFCNIQKEIRACMEEFNIKQVGAEIKMVHQLGNQKWSCLACWQYSHYCRSRLSVHY